MRKNSNIIAAIVLIAIGLLLIVLKGAILRIVISLFGAAILLGGILDFTRGLSLSGTPKSVAGLFILAAGWLFVSLSLYVVAAVLLLFSIRELIFLWQAGRPYGNWLQFLPIYAKPLCSLLAGMCLLFNQNGAISWVFVVTGVFLLMEGILMLLDGKHSG